MAKPIDKSYSVDGTRSAESQTPTTKNAKRSRDVSVQITHIRPAKKTCRLSVGSISVPRNDADIYKREEQMHLFYTLCPLDFTNIKSAKENGYWNRVTYGMHGNRVVEALVADEDDGTPWQVPKVNLKFHRINYKTSRHSSTAKFSQKDGQPVSPMTIPNVGQMTRAEYERAVELGDSRIAIDDRFTFEFLQDAGLDWSPYVDRLLEVVDG